MLDINHRSVTDKGELDRFLYQIVSTVRRTRSKVKKSGLLTDR
jgi:hypothetical protein